MALKGSVSIPEGDFDMIVALLAQKTQKDFDTAKAASDAGISKGALEKRLQRFKQKGDKFKVSAEDAPSNDSPSKTTKRKANAKAESPTKGKKMKTEKGDEHAKVEDDIEGDSEAGAEECENGSDACA